MMIKISQRLSIFTQSLSNFDFVIQTPENLWALEVKSGRMRTPRGLEKFLALHKRARPFIISGTGMSLEEFFSTDPKEIFL